MKNGISLYELNNIIESILDEGLKCDDETGEVLFDESDLEALNMARNEKIENICCYIKGLKAEAEALKAEKQALEKRQKNAANKAERLSAYLEEMLGGEKFKSAKAAVSYRKSESVNVLDLDKIPMIYLRYKDPEVDKAAVKRALKDGEAVDGAEIITKVSMSIR